MNNQVLIRASREIWNDRVVIHIGERNSLTGALYVAKPPEYCETAKGEPIGEPCLSLIHEDAQRLMDELWNCGLRPSEGSGSAGSLAATQNHLKDMQGIAFALLKKYGAQV